jgi:hypothetical protein
MDTPADTRPPAGDIDPAWFLDHFTELFEHTSYRLETLDYYDDPGERETFRGFREGKPVPRNQWWLDFIRQARRDGKVMARVHVVSEPLSEYMEFEIAAYLANGYAAGEDVRILPRPQAEEFNGVPDYWLMDSRLAVLMSYDGGGVLTRVEAVTDPRTVADCCRWRDVAMHRAIPLGDYTKRRLAHDDPRRAVPQGR